ncbi:hypothetical protein VF_2586 [Aliivibrio fischeri ES114]|uniref:Uncharacterized protein n=1 Tax=Aliivibrio fischeri (strain ATCC 700601 / ES114) TaxID=312309 RepID=B1WMZ8_ALIF1|nr:hypothetical protein VF_2586 [Aliivibrio fischeri ES114]
MIETAGNDDLHDDVRWYQLGD